MEVPCCLYPYPGEMIVVDTIEKRDHLLHTREYFSHPTKAREFHFLHRVTMWTIREASFLLAGEDPLPLDKAYSTAAANIEAMLQSSDWSGEIQLIKQKNFREKNKNTAQNIVFIRWAIEKKLNISQEFTDYLNSTLPKKKRKNDRNAQTKYFKNAVLKVSDFAKSKNIDLYNENGVIQCTKKDLCQLMVKVDSSVNLLADLSMGDYFTDDMKLNFQPGNAHGTSKVFLRLMDILDSETTLSPDNQD